MILGSPRGCGRAVRPRVRARAIVRSVRPAHAIDSGTRALRWFVLALAATLLLLHAGFDTTEGSNHAQTAINWIETGRLGQPERPARIFVQGIDGLYYPAHELGAVLWHLPAAAAVLAVEWAAGSPQIPGSDARFAHTAITFNSLLFSLAIATGFWKWLEWRFALTAAARLRATTVLMFATLLLPYSRALTDVSSTAAWLVWGMAFTARATRGGGAWAAALAGVCFGAAGATRTAAAAVILPMMAVLAVESSGRSRVRHLAALAAGALPFVLLVLWFNDLRTDSPWLPALRHSQYANVQPELGNYPDGVLGTLFSPGKSFFVFSPILLLSVAGFARLWKEARVEAAALAASLALFLAAHGGIQVWTGDWAWGPRYSIFITPFLWLPGALLYVRLVPGSPGRRAASALLVVSLAAQCVPLAINWQYQYHQMWAGGRLDGGTPWRADNQMTDALRAAPANIARTFGADIPLPGAVPGMSASSMLASTGINLWWVTALRAGVPPAIVWPMVLTIAAVAAAAWRRAWRAARQPASVRG
jgi:hypothetical protein